MSAENDGVIRVGRKGIKSFAIGEDGKPFKLDVVQAYQHWIAIDDEFRPLVPDEDGKRPIPLAEMPRYHNEAVAFVQALARDPLNPEEPIEISRAEALEFITLLQSEWYKLIDFFQDKSPVKPESPDTSEAALHFSAEE